MATEKRLIYADDLKQKFDEREAEDIELYGALIRECFPADEAKEIVDKMSAVDAVKVVRCKNCIFWRRYDESNLGECNGMDIYQSMHANDFCSYGERKEK